MLGENAMNYDTSAALRHAPKQNRGQRKVDHILRSAEALFAETGFENATTNAIATRAGVSIGSLYQFFASKEAILEAMAMRYLEQTKLALDDGLAYDHETDLNELIPRLVQLMVKMQEQRPYFLQCLSVSRPSPALAPHLDKINDYFAERVAGLLAATTTETDAKTLTLRSRICVVTMGSLLPLALRSKGRARTTAIDEISQVMLRYVQPTLKEQRTA
jgi:AcrR family transcriptional regulator